MEPITLGAVALFAGTTLGQLLVDQVTDLATDVAKDKVREALSRQATRRGRRPTNHDVQKAIFQAQSDANRTFAASISRRGVSFPTLEGYARSLDAWLEAREGVAGWSEVPDVPAIDIITAGLSADDGLAFLRAKLEAAVWEELAQAEPNPPDQALLIFKELWFDAFVDHLTRQIKENSPFRNYLQAWLLVELRSGVDEIGQAALRIEAGLGDISGGVDALTSTTASIQGTVEEIRERLISGRQGGGSSSTYPFIQIDRDFPDFGTHPKSSPLPTFEEYRDGNVPGFAVDQSVKDRLDADGRVFIQGAPSVGKSALAFRFAAQQWSQNRPAYYLDLGTLSEDDRKADVLDALRICRGRPCLVIIDNAHRDAKLAFECWSVWKSDEGPSWLIMLAVRQSDDHGASSKLSGLRLTAVEMSNDPADLAAVASYLYRRSTGHDLKVPSSAATLWQTRFAGQLHAFSLAIQQSLLDLGNGEYRSLTMERAHAWIRQNWLTLDRAGGLDAKAVENLMCIARYGAQDLELSVSLEALPFSQDIAPLRQMGLCVDSSADASASIRLAEPGWGQLILDAAGQPASDNALFDIASRSPALASRLLLRFRHNGQVDRQALLLEWLFGDVAFCAKLRRSPPPLVWSFIDRLDKMNREDLIDRVWEALIEVEVPFGGQPWTSPVSMLGALLNRFKDRGQDASVIWDRLASLAETGAGEILRTPLEHLASFIDRANGGLHTKSRHRRNPQTPGCSATAAAFWAGIESRPAALKAKFGREPIPHIVKFLEVARRHGRNVDDLWRMFLESRDTSPAILALEPAAHITPFVDLALDEALARDVLLWAIADGEAFVRRLLTEPLGEVASLLGRAYKKHIELSSVDRALICGGGDVLKPTSLQISYATLSSFLKHLTTEAKAALLADQPESFWDQLAARRSKEGAPWVARHCKEAGLVDRCSDLVRSIIAEPQVLHFNAFDQSSLKLLCWVTAEGLEAGIAGTEDHLRAIHSEKWVKGYYGFPAPGANALCDGLRTAGLRLPRYLRTILDSPELHHRVNVEARAENGSLGSLVKAIRMRGWYGRIAPNKISSVDYISNDLAVRVVTEGLPHRPEALVLEPFQIDLWVGLRAIAARSGRAITTDRAALERTLALWEPLQAQESLGLVAQVFHADMVSWLRQAVPQARLPPLVLPQ